MIKTAVILAAGLGSRIRKTTGEHPKGLLLLDQLPIIEHSIQKLLEVGITKIYVGTGFKQEDYHALSAKYPQLQFVHNPSFNASGSMYTLYLLKDVVKDDFLLLESDVIYEKKALTVLLEHEKDNVILASRFTQSGDEVFIETDESHHLLSMSKNKTQLKNILGELVGITKLSQQGFQELTQVVEPMISKNLHIDYEQGLIELAKNQEVIVTLHNDLVWCEVDDAHHWQRAKTVIFPLIKAREKLNENQPVQRNVLLNPGPATTTDTVKYAQIVPDICPREQDFGSVMEFVSTELTKLAGNPTDYTTVLFAGSGTAAVEAILSSVIEEDAILLIINNGAYGKRMCQIAKIYRLKFLEYTSPPDQPLDLNQLENFIAVQAEKISYLGLIHCETTTGLLNPLSELGRICQRYDITMIVDAMSSFAAIPIDMKAMNISYLAASSNKNLQGTAGVSFIIANKAALEKSKDIPARNLYLNLYQQYRSFQQTKQMQFTPPVQTLYALKQAIIETIWEGIENRYARYTKSWETLITGISRLDMTYLVPKNSHSKIITSIIEPDYLQYNFNEMHNYFYENGFTIYPGKLDQQNTFRVANIGNIDDKDMKRFIDLLEIYLIGLKGGDSNS